MALLNKSFRNFIDSVKRNPGKVMILLFLQLIVVASILFSIGVFQYKIMEEVIGIISPLQDANFNLNSIQEGGTFLPNEQKVIDHYNNIKKFVYYFIGSILFILLTLNWSLWVLVEKIVRKDTSWKKHWLKYSSMVLLFSFLFVLTIYFFGEKIMIKGMQQQIIPNEIYFLFVLSAMYYYFFLAGVGVCTIKSWKSFIASWLNFTIEKVSRMGPIFVLLTTLSTIPIYLIFYFEGKSYVLSIGLLILFIILQAATKLFWRHWVKLNEKSNN